MKCDKEGRYAGYVVKREFGTGDSWRECYKGMRYLKRNCLSDVTFSGLDASAAPYRVSKGPDLAKIRAMPVRDDWKPDAGHTLHYTDAAILIREPAEGFWLSPVCMKAFLSGLSDFR